MRGDAIRISLLISWEGGLLGQVCFWVFGFSHVWFVHIDMLVTNFTDEPLLTRVQAFLTLAAACVFFVIMILLFEQSRGGTDGSDDPT